MSTFKLAALLSMHRQWGNLQVGGAAEGNRQLDQVAQENRSCARRQGSGRVSCEGTREPVLREPAWLAPSPILHQRLGPRAEQLLRP